MSDTTQIVIRVSLYVAALYLFAIGSAFLWIVPALMAAAPMNGDGDCDPCGGE